MAVRCQETVNEMNVKLKNQEMVRFFCVFGMDMFYAGSTKFRGGSIIGVPRCFAYETVNDIEKNDIVVCILYSVFLSIFHYIFHYLRILYGIFRINHRVKYNFHFLRLKTKLWSGARMVDKCFKTA